MSSAQLGWREPDQDIAHGGGVVILGESGDFPTEPLFDELSRRGLRSVWPKHRDIWWTDRLTPDESGETAERFLLESVLPAARERWVETAPVAILGFGPGGHGALRIAYQRAREFPVVAAWRPAVTSYQLWNPHAPKPPGLDAAALRSLLTRYRDAEQCRQDAALLHIHPLGWPRCQWFGCPPGDFWWEGCDLLHGKLNAIGVPHECELGLTAPKNDPELASRVVRWISEQLAEEARRLP